MIDRDISNNIAIKMRTAKSENILQVTDHDDIQITLLCFENYKNNDFSDMNFFIDKKHEEYIAFSTFFDKCEKITGKTTIISDYSSKDKPVTLSWESNDKGIHLTFEDCKGEDDYPTIRQARTGSKNHMLTDPFFVLSKKLKDLSKQPTF